MSQTFAVNTTDPAGATDIASVWLYFIPTFNTNPAGACQVYYDRASNYLYLMNDTGTAALPALLGSSTTLSNSQCSLNALTSTAIGSGTLLTVNFAISFTSVANGLKQMYVKATNGNSDTGWLNPGAWNVVAPPGEFTITATPTSQAVLRGGRVSYTVTVTPNAPGANITLTPSGAPAGSTVTLTPTTFNGAGAATLTIATTSATPIATSTSPSQRPVEPTPTLRT
jgi:hypothetical protein